MITSSTERSASYLGQAGAQSSSVTHAEAAPEGKLPLFPENATFWYETGRAFGAASYGASEFGEVLVTASRIKSGDFDSWYEEWNRLAEKVAREAADQLVHGHRISARDSFLRAPTYYCASEFSPTRQAFRVPLT